MEDNIYSSSKNFFFTFALEQDLEFSSEMLLVIWWNYSHKMSLKPLCMYMYQNGGKKNSQLTIADQNFNFNRPLHISDLISK